MILAGSTNQNTNSDYFEEAPAENEPPKNTNSNSNSSVKYNYTITSNGVGYLGIHNGKFGVCLKSITLQDEIYCDFDRSPRAMGKFHVVEYLVGNEQNEPFSQGQVYLITDDGRKFSSDTNATSIFTTMKDFNNLHRIINPKIAVRGYQVFDIPTNATVVKLRYEEFFGDAIEVPYKIVKE